MQVDGPNEGKSGTRLLDQVRSKLRVLHLAKRTEDACLGWITKVLNMDLKVDAIRAKTPQRIPTVLSNEEVALILSNIPSGPKRLLICLL